MLITPPTRSSILPNALVPLPNCIIRRTGIFWNGFHKVHPADLVLAWRYVCSSSLHSTGQAASSSNGKKRAMFHKKNMYATP